MVRTVGIEPTLLAEQDFEMLLNPARLPIPPRPHICCRSFSRAALCLTHSANFTNRPHPEHQGVLKMVPPVRLERTLLAELDFEWDEPLLSH